MAISKGIYSKEDFVKKIQSIQKEVSLCKKINNSDSSGYQ